MGLREKVTIILMIIALIQIACRHCMPRTPRKASLKRYLNDLKPVKNNPAPTPYSLSRLNKTPKQTIGKTSLNGKSSRNSIPKKSLYQTYKFPEIEYPLDNSPRDPFHVGVNFNDNNHVSTLQKARNLHSAAINDLKKEMKMKRKLLSNKQMNNENKPLKTEMSSIKFASNPDSKHLPDSESFPEVQYPLNTMDTWGSNYRSYLPFTQENQFNGFGQKTLNRQAKEDINKSFTRLTKAKASKYLQPYDKLKEEQRRTSTENSKRNAGQKGLNFTKTATCEKISDDFMTAGLVSNIPSNSKEIKIILEPSTKTKPCSENTCPVTVYPIPYKFTENDTENICAFEQKNNTKELQDMDTSVIAQTLQLIEEILFCDDTSSAVSTDNYSKKLENNVDSYDCTDVLVNEDTPTTLMDSAKNCTDCPTESQEVSDDAPSGILQDNIPSFPEEILADNSTTVKGPLSVSMPLRFFEPIEFEAVTNASKLGQTNMAPIANSNTVPGSTSIIIIPFNNNSDGKSLSHILQSTTDTPLIVYLSSTRNSGIPSQIHNQIMSSSLDNSLPNTELYDVLSNMAPLQNDNPPSTALISELLNSISASGSSLPMYETLPTNSMCYNNESSPASIKDKPISDILVDKSLADDAPLSTAIFDEKLLQQLAETDNFHMNTETMLPTPDFEHSLFDFAGSEFSSLSHGPYNNILKNELPILSCEINPDQQISNFASKDLFNLKQNETSEYLYKNISAETLPEVMNDASTVALNQNFSFETPTDSLPQPIIIYEMPPTALFDTTVEQQLPTRTPLSLTPLSETLTDNSSEIMDMKLPPISSTTTIDSPQLLENVPLTTPIVINSPLMTDVTLKAELYKIRQILDKMLSSATPLTDSKTTPMDAILSPISDTYSLPMLVNESLEPTQTLIDSDSVSLPAEDNKLLPLLENDTSNDSLRLQGHETLPYVLVDGSSSDIVPMPVDKSRIPSSLLDTADSPTLLIDETVTPTPVFENPAENKSYLLDNLVTPLSETRTKYTPKNDLSRATDDVPSKMDTVIPNIYEVTSDDVTHIHEVYSDDLSSTVGDLPLMMHQEHTTIPKSEDLLNKLSMQVVEPPNFISDVSVSDLLCPTETLSMPEIPEAILPDVSSKSQTTTMSGYTNQRQNFSTTTVCFSEVETEQKIDLPLSILSDVSHSESSTNKPFLLDDLPSPINAEIGEYPHTPADIKDLPLVEDRLMSRDDNSSLDTSVTHIPSTVSLSIKLDKTNDEELSEYTLSDLPRDDLILIGHYMFPLTDNIPTDLRLQFNKTPTTSKLSVAKALLENVLSDITKPDLSSSPVNKTLSLTPPSLLDKTIYHVDSESPVLEAKEPSLDKIFPKTAASTNLPNPETPEYVLSLPVDKAPLVTPNLNIPSKVMPLKIDEMSTGLSPDNQTDDIEKCFSPQERTEMLPLDNPDDVLLPRDKVPLRINTVDRNSLSNKSTLSASKLPITTKDFSVPTASKAFPVKSPSVLDQTFYLESPLSDLTEEISSPSQIPLVYENLSSITHFDQPTDNNLALSEQSEDSLDLKVDKTLAEVSCLNIPSEMSSLMSKTVPKSNIDITSPKAGILSIETPSDLPSSNTKTHSPSKLPIAKVLLQNVLLDVTSKSFSLPVSKALPVKSPSVIDKTFYYLESPLSDRTELSNLSSVNEIISSTTVPDQPSDNKLPSAGKSKETLPMEIDKTLSQVSSLDIPSKITSLMDKSPPKSSPKAEILLTDRPSDLPLSNSKTISSSKLPITKALLDNILSDVTTPDFSLPVAQVLQVKSSSVLDKTLNKESPLSDLTEESPLPSINKIISSTTLSDQPNEPFIEQPEDALPLEVDKMHSEVSSLEIPPEMSSSLADKVLSKSNVDITSSKADILPKDTPCELPLLNTQTLSSSKLPIAKALLQNVLSDITSKGFSLPVSKDLPVKSSSVLDETLYCVESPLSDPSEGIPLSSVNDIISCTTLLHQRANNNFISGQSEETLPLEVDKIPSEMSSLMSNVDITSPEAEIIPKATPSDLPLPNTKTISSSKLSITKELLENVLLDINTKGFSLPIAKSPPAETRTLLDKTLYYMESPHSD